MEVKGRRYKLRWSQNNEVTGGNGVMVREKLCEKVVEVRRKRDRVTALGLISRGFRAGVCKLFQ